MVGNTFNPDPAKERAIREALGRQLGVEFYDPEDPDVSQEVGKGATMDPDGDPARQMKPITVGDIIRQAQQCARASNDRNVRRTLYLCGTALMQMVDRLEEANSIIRRLQAGVSDSVLAGDDDEG